MRSYANSGDPTQPEAVQLFADDSRDIIDTKDLYQMWRAVQLDEVTASDANQCLMSSRGSWDS